MRPSTSLPQAFVAFMDGIVMGGGVGISAHGNLRLVTGVRGSPCPKPPSGTSPTSAPSSCCPARTRRDPGPTTAMTGARDQVPTRSRLDWPDALVENAATSGADRAPGCWEALDAVKRTSTAGDLDADRDWVDSCYAGDDPVAGLMKRGTSGAPGRRRQALRPDILATRSPLAVSVALGAIRRAARMDTLGQVLEQDPDARQRFRPGSPDFVEGVRALLVDRGTTPRAGAMRHWRMSTPPR